MSHLKERKGKNCLNCNAAIHGRFCHICGQENIEAKESVWHLVNHYFQDITHFDGKFFSTLGYLIKRPGFLSMEYMNGRRASYLNPIRMYVFTSAVFFLFFFFIVKSEVDGGVEKVPYSSTAFLAKINSKIAAIERLKKLTKDSAKIKKFDSRIKRVRADADLVRRDSIAGKKLFAQYEDMEGMINFTNESYSSKATYDTLQHNLPANERDNFFERKLVYKSLEIKDKYKDANWTVREKLMDNFFHKFPQIMFISLPVFALLLKLLYFRRKIYYYADHIIFTIHLYVLSFILMLLIFAFQEIADHAKWLVFDVLSILLCIAVFLYQYKAMRNFYQQSRGKTILKFCLVNLLALLFMILLFTVFFLFSFLQT